MRYGNYNISMFVHGYVPSEMDAMNVSLQIRLCTYTYVNRFMGKKRSGDSLKKSSLKHTQANKVIL